MEIRDERTGGLVPRTEAGEWEVTEQADYLVRADGSVLPEHRFLKPIKGANGIGILSFGNYVGLAEIGGERILVKNSKLTSAMFDTMLDQVVGEFSDLAFGFQSPTALPFEHDQQSGSSLITFHSLAYLRHVMRRLSGGEGLAGQFLEIARNPHRRMDRESVWIEPHAVAHADPELLMGLIANPDKLRKVVAGMTAARTGLASHLRRGSDMFFPTEVRSHRHTESFDTHENRLVLHVLGTAAAIVKTFADRKLTDPLLARDVREMSAELEWLRTFDFLKSVRDMTIVPSQSSVIQRRDGYREFLSHHFSLGLCASLNDDRDLWRRLLDLKDCALLYELWTFFEVKRVLDDLLGRSHQVSLTNADEESRNVPWATRVVYEEGSVELVYNASFHGGAGSYSVAMRPDIALKVRRMKHHRVLLLDAKLKFEGERLAANADEPPETWERSATRDDLLKMHAYRDAIVEAVGAFVLYPGSKEIVFPTKTGLTVSGVGAIPLVPGENGVALTRLVECFLKRQS